ncbi:unnamed protein product [Bursaphelenchus xylophilus]|uniref:(pine wood nematode) hypothetical protein n=1 Tax=Bursaphelenchus xylophilus TaxID=6326 RepID=A0A1I7SLP5_BURXY|nr:unnamed protein product [Bursaphelenchus xylophilus]CAG9129693.1 unnamed protein product [Bursaphelenchus xylophilus]
MDQPGPSNVPAREQKEERMNVHDPELPSTSQTADQTIGNLEIVEETTLGNDTEILDLDSVSEVSQQSAEEQEETPHLAYLKRSEAITQVMEGITFEPAANWNTNDLAALFSRLRNTNCNQFSVETFIHAFSNTSVEEIMAILEGLRDIVREADSVRIPWKEALKEGKVPTDEAKGIKGTEKQALDEMRQLTRSVAAKKKGMNIMSEVLTQALNVLDGRTKRRKRSASGSTKENVKLSDDFLSPACEYEGDVNYDDIYDCLESISLIRSTKKMRATESAVLIQIFDELQEIVDSSFTERADFMTQFLSEYSSQLGSDVGWIDFPANEEMGQKIWNFLDLPDDFLDLSEYVVEEEAGRVVLKK